MNKQIIFIFLIILLLIVIFNKNEQFTSNSDSTCNSGVNQNTGLYSCGDNDCCLENVTGGFCNTEGDNDEDNNFNRVVDPTEAGCVDFCVKTYTNTDPNDNNFGDFIDETRLPTFVSSRCAQCITNYYERLKLLNDPFESTECTEEED